MGSCYNRCRATAILIQYSIARTLLLPTFTWILFLFHTAPPQCTNILSRHNGRPAGLMSIRPVSPTYVAESLENLQMLTSCCCQRGHRWLTQYPGWEIGERQLPFVISDKLIHKQRRNTTRRVNNKKYFPWRQRVRERCCVDVWFPSNDEGRWIDSPSIVSRPTKGSASAS